MATERKKMTDESLISFYHDKIVTQADLVYRFAFCLTLSLDQSMQIVKSVFEKVAGDLSPGTFHERVNVKGLLLAETWVFFKQNRLAKSKIQSLTLAKQATKFFESLEIESRATLFLVDIAGLSIADACKCLNGAEHKIRQDLGTARKSLVNTSFEA